MKLTINLATPDVGKWKVDTQNPSLVQNHV